MLIKHKTPLTAMIILPNLLSFQRRKRLKMAKFSILPELCQLCVCFFPVWFIGRDVALIHDDAYLFNSLYKVNDSGLS